MKVIFCDFNTVLCENVSELIRRFDISDKIEVFNGDFRKCGDFDAIVAAGNSFGVMSGGIDLHIRRFFNEHRGDLHHAFDEEGNFLSMECLVRKKIREDYFGELPVGSSIIVETEVSKHPFIVYSPTMRAPQFLSPENNNVYNATLSSVMAIKRHNRDHEEKIETVVYSGMGTGTGLFPLDLTAMQMFSCFLKLVNELDVPKNVVLGDKIEESLLLGIGTDK